MYQKPDFEEETVAKVICRVFIWLSCILFLQATTLVRCAMAAPVQSADFISAQVTGEKRTAVIDFLARQDVSTELSFLGIDSSEAQQRVAALTDAEVAELHAALPDIPAGADGLGTVVGAILLVFFVLLLTDILGLTKVYPFTRSVG